MAQLKKNTGLFLLFTLLAYPILYYAYKYGTPQFGGLDVYSYYKLYSNWDFAHVDSPFNQRILSSFAIFLVHKSGIHYSTETAIQALHLDPQVYFSALLFNFLCVVLTCMVIYRTIAEELRADAVFSFLAALLFLLGFGTITFLVSALSDALSTLMMALAFRFFLKKSNWQYLILLAAVFQREYILLVFGLLAALYWLKHKTERRYYLTVFLVSVGCFLIYFVCRKTIFFTPRYVHQIDMGQLFSNISKSLADMKGYFSQTFLIQNILFVYIVIFGYKKLSGKSVNGFHMTAVFVLLAQIVVLSFLIGLGNNTGRYFYMTVPIVIYYLALELKPLLGKNGAGEVERHEV